MNPAAQSSSARPAAVRDGRAEAESWAVLGAGAIGLSVARRLAEAGRAVTVYEKDDFVGGQAGSFEVEPGVWLERFYHHAFKSDRVLQRTYADLGLTGMSWHRPITATLVEGGVFQLDSAASVLRFRHLPVPDRLRMGVALAALRIMPGAGLLEGRAAGPWLRRWMGRAAYERVWRPLLEGKFGVDGGEVALPWFWARVHDRSSVLGYPLGGFRALYETLAERIGTSGGAILLNTPVDSLERDRGRVRGSPARCGQDVVLRGRSNRARCGGLRHQFRWQELGQRPWQPHFQWQRSGQLGWSRDNGRRC